MLPSRLLFASWSSYILLSVLPTVAALTAMSPAIPQTRKLAVGDFAIINEVFRDIRLEIDVPDPIEIGSGIGTVEVTLQNLVCTDIEIGDILLSYEQPTETSVNFDLNVIKFDIRCAFDYEYDAPLGINGAASAIVETNDNSFRANLLLSQSSAAVSPDGFAISNCQPGLDIINLDFDGGVVAFILNIIEPRLRNTIEGQVENFLCDYISDLQGNALELLETIADFIDPYLVPVTLTDPLAAEMALFNGTLGVDASAMIDFQEPKGAIAIGVDVILKEASRILGNERSDRDAPSGTGKDLGINVLIRDFLLDDEGAFTINTTSLAFLNDGNLLETTAGNIADLEIRIEQVKLQGLDSFTRFDPFTDIGRFTLQSFFGWEYTALEVDFYVSLGPVDSDEKVEERIKVSTRADNLEFEFAALLGINEDALGALKIGDILDSAEILPCIFSAVDVINISSLILTVGTIEDPVIQDIESPGLARLLGTGIEGMYELLDELILVALPGLFQTTVRDLVNEELMKLMGDTECNPVEAKSDSALMDFRDLFLSPSKALSMGARGTQPYGDIGGLLLDVVDDLLISVNPKTGRPNINEAIIAPLAAFQSGEDGILKYNGTLFSVKGGLDLGGLDAEIVIEAFNARLENLDTVSNPLRLIEPINSSGYKVDNDLTVGLAERPLRGVGRLLFSMQGTDIAIRDEIDISVNLVEARVELLALIKMLASQLFSFPLRSIIDINCWLATLPVPELDEQGVRLDGAERSAGIAELVIFFQKLSVDVTCIECTSPGMQELAELLQEDQATEGVTDAANALLDYVTSLLDGEFIQIFLDRAIAEAPARCPHSPAYEPDFQGLKLEPFETVEPTSDSIWFLLTVGIIAVGIIIAFVLIGFVVRCFVRRRNRTWVQTLPSQTVFRIYREQKREEEKAKHLRETTASMFVSKEVPLIVRWSIPVIIIGNIALFLSGHLSIGGAVSVYIQFAGEQIVIENIFTFSVAESAVQLWDAGGKELAIMILIFSGVWPYTKQIITLVAWFLPPQWLSVRRRGSIFLWLDALAKWSSADIFFLIVSLAAFNISVQSPEVSFLPNEFYNIDILLIPLWGLYANLIAQLLSQVSSHVIIHYHRKIVEKALNQLGSDEDQTPEFDDLKGTDDIAIRTASNDHRLAPPEKLRKHKFMRPHRGVEEKLKIRRGVSSLLIGAAATTTVLIVVGCILPTFSFEQLGVLGVAVEIGRKVDEARNFFSVIGIAQTLIGQGLFLGDASNIIGMTAIAMLLILTILIVPLVQIGMLCYQWFGSMNEAKRGKVEVGIEILSAWQYLEVYLLAVMVSAWQLGPTSEYLINSYCANLTDTFSSLVFFGVLSEEDAQCFKLSAAIEEGCFVLIAAAFVLVFVSTFVMKAVFQYQRDKADEQRREIESQNPDAMTQHLIATMAVEEAIEQIHPTPVLFSDTFRWLLDSAPSRTSADHASIPQGNSQDSARFDRAPQEAQVYSSRSLQSESTES